MQDPVSGLPRTPLTGSRVNKGIRKGRGLQDRLTDPRQTGGPRQTVDLPSQGDMKDDER